MLSQTSLTLLDQPGAAPRERHAVGAVLLIGRAGRRRVSAVLPTVESLHAEAGLAVSIRGGTDAAGPMAGVRQVLHQVLDHIGGPPVHLGGPDLDTRALTASLTELLSDAARVEPVLLTADDLAGIDPPSRDLLTGVVRALLGRPVTVLLAARVQGPTGAGSPAPGRLGPLHPSEVSRLLDATSAGCAPRPARTCPAPVGARRSIIRPPAW